MFESVQTDGKMYFLLSEAENHLLQNLSAGQEQGGIGLCHINTDFLSIWVAAALEKR